MKRNCRRTHTITAMGLMMAVFMGSAVANPERYSQKTTPITIIASWITWSTAYLLLSGPRTP
jgi:hypothetical protein